MLYNQSGKPMLLPPNASQEQLANVREVLEESKHYPKNTFNILERISPASAAACFKVLENNKVH